MKFLDWFRTKQPTNERSRITPPAEKRMAPQPREPDVEALRKRRDLDGLLRAVRDTGPSFSASVPVRGAAAKAFAELAGPRAFEILSAEIAETDRVLAKMRELLDLCLTSEMKRKPSEDIRALVSLKELLVEARIRCVPVAASLAVPAPPASPEPPSDSVTPCEKLLSQLKAGYYVWIIEAAEALGDLGDDAALPALEALATHGVSDVTALLDLGGRSRIRVAYPNGSIPAIDRELLWSELGPRNDLVKKAARRAIEKIRASRSSARSN